MEISSSPRRSILLIGILIFVATLSALALLGGSMLKLFGATELNATVMAASRIFFWTSLLVVFVYARKVEKQKLLVWEERKFDAWEYIVSVIAIFVALVIGLIIIGIILTLFGLQQESERLLKMLVIFREHHWLIFLTAFTAGIVEELTFRGYLLPRMIILFKSPAAAILVSSVLFGLAHFGYGTVIQLVGPFFIGFIFALYYYKFRNIKVIIFVHVMWDVMSIYLKLWAETLKTNM